MPPGVRPERAILKMAQRTLRPDLRWGLGRLPASGPKPDQDEQQYAGTQADNMRCSKTAMVQAIHAMIATIARTTIMPAKRTRFAVMPSALDLLGSGFCAVFVGFRIALHDISITIEGR
jgi:hypothetical protein